jgi:hypothetical protein
LFTGKNKRSTTGGSRSFVKRAPIRARAAHESTTVDAESMDSSDSEKGTTETNRGCDLDEGAVNELKS